MSTAVDCSVSAGITQTSDAITPYEVISLLLDGALERIDRAVASIGDGDISEAAMLIHKTVEIVASLRESLDFEKGGDIATNLDALYEYILMRLESIDTDEPIEILSEVKNLLAEIYAGWRGIARQINTDPI